MRTLGVATCLLRQLGVNAVRADEEGPRGTLGSLSEVSVEAGSMVDESGNRIGNGS